MLFSVLKLFFWERK